ncbi:restriction endonuclease subunit S [Glaesserella parasuis]|nr:restriction endonuclease subunit S [Glaesserella parasuis]
MIESRFIEKLLNGREVEWKPLGNILTRTKGTKITAGQMKALHKENAPIKIFAGGKTFALVNFGDIPEKDINKNPSIIVKSRGIIEFEYYDKVFSHKNEMWSYYSQNERISTKYIYYFLKQNEAYFQNIGSKMQMPQIAIPDTDKFLVPIPPLDVQQEIVRILDAFTSLTAELTSRQKQYQYFRDKLLNFDDISDRGGGTRLTLLPKPYGTIRKWCLRLWGRLQLFL